MFDIQVVLSLLQFGVQPRWQRMSLFLGHDKNTERGLGVSVKKLSEATCLHCDFYTRTESNPTGKV